MKKTTFICILFLSFVICTSSIKTQCMAATYHITHTTSFVWKANCTVNTSGTNIRNVNNVQVHALTGHLIKEYLTRDSSSQYTLHIVQKIGVLTSRYGLRIKYYNHKIIVTVI
ncbi:MAG: DUF5626 family protein [Liquorilactobacillus ghanensis]|uniref:hypothetical protein n=1 Tax=Liquorilactobacillus ghanensis TaxID=399370 RepID=UPI0039E8CD85